MEIGISGTAYAGGLSVHRRSSLFLYAWLTFSSVCLSIASLTAGSSMTLYHPSPKLPDVFELIDI